MTISTLIGSRLLSGIAAFALTGSLVGGTAIAAQPDSPVREIRHEVRDQSKAQRDEIKQLRAEFAAEYAKQAKGKLDMGKSCIRFKKPEQIPMKLIGELASKVTPGKWIEVYEKNVKP